MSLNGFGKVRFMSTREILRDAMKYRSRRLAVLFVGGTLFLVVVALAIWG